MNRRNQILLFTLLAILVMVISPTGTMSSDGQEYSNITLLDEYDDVPQLMKDLVVSVAEFNKMERFEGALTGTTSTLTLANSYDWSKTIGFLQVGLPYETDDAEELDLTWFPATSTTVTFDINTYNIGETMVLWLVEFSSGVTVTRPSNQDTTGTYAIGHTVDMSKTFVLSAGSNSADTFYRPNSASHPYLASTTTYGYGLTSPYAESFYDARVQIVEVDGVNVYRGTKTWTAASTSVAIGATVIAEQSTIFISGGSATELIIQTNKDATIAYFSSDTGSVSTFTLSAQDYNPDYGFKVFWEVVEWPSILVSNVQWVSDEISHGEFTEDVTISEVDLSRTIALLAGGSSRPFSWATACESGRTDDRGGGTSFHTSFTSTTNLRLTVQVSTGNYGGAVVKYQIIEWASNEIPVNDAAPVCTNLDDGDNLYARYKTYIFTSNVSDADGYEDIDYVFIQSYDYVSGPIGYFVRWGVQYVESTNVFTEINGAGAIELDTSGSSYVKNGNDLDITWRIKIEWAHPDSADDDFRQYVRDEAGVGDDDVYGATNYDYETRLNWDVAPAVTDDDAGIVDRGDWDELFTMAGTLEYYGSASSIAPPNDAVDVWISASEYGTNVGPWGDLALDNGQFSKACWADDATGQDTYTVKPVISGAGSGGSTLYYTTDLTDTYIADRSEVYAQLALDGRVNVDSNGRPRFQLRLEYDNHLLNDGTNDDVWIEGAVATWGGTRWYRNILQSTVGLWSYEATAAYEATYGITGFDSASAATFDCDVIYDGHEVYWSSRSDDVTNLNENEYPMFRLRSLYDGHLLDDGTNDEVYINSILATWDAGESAWIWTTSYGTSGWKNFKVTSFSEDTYGITALDTSSATTYDTDIAWTGLIITITDPTDQYININTNASGIFVSAVYQTIGGTFDGTLTLNNTNYEYATAQKQGYTVSSASGDTYDITYIITNDETWCWWLSLTIFMTNPTDQYININENASGIVVTATYDALGGSYDGTLTLNNTDFDYPSAQIQGYKVSSAAGDDTYGITAISDATDETWCWWLSLIISITDPTDQYINIGANASGIVVSATYAVMGGAYDGTLNLNNTQYSYANAQKQGYKVSSADGDDTYGITVISDATDETWCWWLSLTISMTDPTDQEINIEENATGIFVSAIYDTLGGSFDGTFTLNDTTFTYGTVSKHGWTVESVSGDTYGITAILTNDETWCIYNQLQVTGIYANTTALYLNEYVLLNVTMIDLYGSDAVITGSFTLEGLSLSWSGVTSTWELEDTESSETTNIYDTVVGADGEGISNIDMNSWTVSVTWNAEQTMINVTLTINFGWTVVSYNISIYYSGVYHPSGDPWSGTCTINSTASTFYPIYATSGVRMFEVTGVTDPLYGIDAYYTVQNATVAWDAVITSSLGWTWEQSDLNSIWMIWYTGTFSWEVNETDIGSGIKIQSYVNSTVNDYANTDPTSRIPDLWIGAFNSNWYFGHFEGVAEDMTVGTRTFDSKFWDTTLSIPIEHTIHIASFMADEYNDYIWFGVWTIWGNSTWSIWDNDSLIIYNEYEGTYKLDKSGIGGWHNLTILVNATDGGGHQSEQAKDFSTSDYWLWINFEYTVAGWGDLYYTVAWSLPDVMQYWLWTLEPQYQTELFFVIWGISDSLAFDYVTSYLTISADVGTYDIEGFYYVVWGQDCFLAPISWLLVKTWAAWWGDSHSNFTMEYDGRTIESANTAPDAQRWIGDTWSEAFPQWDSNPMPTDQITGLRLLIDGFGYLRAPTAGHYIIIENGTQYDSDTLRYDIVLYDMVEGSVYSGLAAPYRVDYTWEILFQVAIDDVMAGWASGDLKWDATFSRAYLEIDLYNIDPNVLIDGVELRLYMKWGVTPYQNITTIDENTTVVLLSTWQSSFTINISPQIIIIDDFALVQDTGLSYSGKTNMAVNITVFENEVAVAYTNITSSGSFSIWWDRAIGDGNITAILMFENFNADAFNITVIYQKLSITPIQLTSFVANEYDDYIWFGVWVNLASNVTWTIWDNDTLIAYIEDAGTHWLNKSITFGWHNLTILVNGTDSGGNQVEQTKDFSISDYWLWINYQYNSTVGIELFAIAGASIDLAVQYIDFPTWSAFEELSGEHIIFLFGNAIQGWIDGGVTTVYWEADWPIGWGGQLAARYTMYMGGQVIAVPINWETIIYNFPLTYGLTGTMYNVSFYLEEGGIKALNYGDYQYETDDTDTIDRYFPAYEGWIPNMENYNEPRLFFTTVGNGFPLVPDLVQICIIENGTWIDSDSLTFDIKVRLDEGEGIYYPFNYTSNGQSGFYFSVYADGIFQGKAFAYLQWNSTTEQWYLDVNLYGMDDDLQYSGAEIELKLQWGVSNLWYEVHDDSKPPKFCWTYFLQENFTIIAYEPPIQLSSFIADEYNDYIWFGVWTVREGATWTIWDNSTLIIFVESEGMIKLNKTTVAGWHNLTILVNRTAGSQESQQSLDFSVSNDWLWVNMQYTVLDLTPSGELWYAIFYSHYGDNMIWEPIEDSDDISEMYIVIYGDAIEDTLRATSQAIIWEIWMQGVNFENVTLEGRYTSYLGYRVLVAIIPYALIVSWSIWCTTYDIANAPAIKMVWSNIIAQRRDGVDDARWTDVFEEEPTVYILHDFANLFMTPSTMVRMVLENGTRISSSVLKYEVGYVVDGFDTRDWNLTQVTNNYAAWGYAFSFDVFLNDKVHGKAKGMFSYRSGDWVMRVWLLDFDTSIWESTTEDITISLELKFGFTTFLNTTDTELYPESAFIALYAHDYIYEYANPVEDMRLAFFDTSNNWIPFESIQVNITYSGVTYSITSPTVAVPTNLNLTLEVFNRWGIILYNQTFNHTQFRSVDLAIYQIIVDNEADHVVRLDMSYNGTYPNITVMLPRNWPTFLYLASANYTMIFTYYEADDSGTLVDYKEVTGLWVSYNYEVFGIGYLKYTGISMTDIKNNIDYTRTVTNNNIDDVDNSIKNIPIPNIAKPVSPTDFWTAVIVFGIASVLFAVGGHGFKGYAIARKTKVFFQKPEDKTSDEVYREGDST